MGPGKKKDFSSGATQFVSGAARKAFSSGSDPDGSYDRLVGREIEDQAQMAFRLAPRIYQVLRADNAEQVPVPSVEFIAELPLDLVFRESSPENPLRQCWFTISSREWQWQLVVEPQGEFVLATLTATPPPSRGSTPQLVWRPTEIWQPFGNNALHLEPTTRGAAPLIVRAP